MRQSRHGAPAFAGRARRGAGRVHLSRVHERPRRFKRGRGDHGSDRRALAGRPPRVDPPASRRRVRAHRPHARGADGSPCENRSRHRLPGRNRRGRDRAGRARGRLPHPRGAPSRRGRQTRAHRARRRVRGALRPPQRGQVQPDERPALRRPRHRHRHSRHYPRRAHREL